MIAYTLAPSLPSCPSSSAYTHTHTTGSFSTLDYFFLEAVPTPPPFVTVFSEHWGDLHPHSDHAILSLSIPIPAPTFSPTSPSPTPHPPAPIPRRLTLSHEALSSFRNTDWSHTSAELHQASVRMDSSESLQ